MRCYLHKHLATGSIRTKVWTCVFIALAGYFIATLSSFYFNSRQATRLAQLQKVGFPLALLSDEVHRTFKSQTEQYENAFLTGEVEQAIQANRLSARILEILEEMKKLTEHTSLYKEESQLIITLKNDYTTFYTLASEAYMRTQSLETSIELQKKVQQLGSSQIRILAAFNNLASLLGDEVERNIQQEQKYAQTNTLFLGFLFVIVLVIATLISRRFANFLLIDPLAQIQSMVTSFALNQEVNEPSMGSVNDEIHTLGTSFWEMTQVLEQTMVSRDFVDNIIKNMSGSLFVFLPDLTLTKVNKTTQILLGQSEETLLGCSMTSLVKEEMLPLFQEKGIQPLLAGEDVVNLEIYLRSEKRGKIPILFSGSVLYDQDNRISALICVANDITERKKVEKTLRKIEIERALAKTASLAAIGELTSSLAHEMRNPLSSIKMNISTIRQQFKLTDPAFQELAAIAAEQSGRLETMLNDLLGYGRPLQLHFKAITFQDLLRDTLTAIAKEKKDKAIALHITDDSTSTNFQVDEELMIRALSNLLLNAIQWSPQGGEVSVSCRLDAITPSQQQARIEIRDHGPGLNEAKMDRLFQPFMTTREGGTGLGLANVRKIIEYHGGSVEASNHPDGGAHFTITFPISPPPVNHL